MIIKPVNYKDCHICKADGSLKAILSSIEYQKHVVVDSWIRNPVAIVYSFNGIDQTWSYVLTDKGVPTLMPSYTMFSRLWHNHMLNDPLQYRWTDADLCLKWDRNYVKTVHKTIEEQLSLWGGEGLCGGAAETIPYKMLQKFHENLQVLVDLLDVRYPGEAIDYKLR